MASFKDLVSGSKPTLVDFYADWCGPCKTLSPIIQEIKNDMGEEVRVIKINVDNNQTLSSKLNVSSIPTLIIYKEGKQLWRANGLQSKHEIITQINAANNPVHE